MRNSHTDENGVTHTTRYIADDKGYRVIGRSSAFTGNAPGSSGSSAGAKVSSTSSSASAFAKSSSTAQVKAQAAAQAKAAADAQAAAIAAAKAKASAGASVVLSAPVVSYNGDIINVEQDTQSHQQVGDAGNAVQGSYRYFHSQN